MTPPGGDPLNYEGHLAMQYILADPIHYAYFHLVNTIPFFLSSSIASYGQIVQQLRDNTGFFQPVALTVVNALTQLRHPTSLRSFLSAFWSVAPTGIEIVWWFLITVIALIALALRRKDSTVLLCAIMVIYFAVLTGPMSDSRYRVPAEPYLIMLAVVGVHTILHRKKSVDTSLSVAIKPASIA